MPLDDPTYWLPSEAETGPTPDDPTQGVDLEALAEWVYELLRRELELENDRTGR